MQAMTTEVEGGPHGVVDMLDDNVRRNVKAIMASGNVRAVDLYTPMGLSKQVFSQRLSGVSRFTAAETRMLAYLLDVPVDLLFEEPSTVMPIPGGGTPRQPLAQQLLQELGQCARSRCSCANPQVDGGVCVSCGGTVLREVDPPSGQRQFAWPTDYPALSVV